MGAYYTATLALNILLNIAISWKIWHILREIRFANTRQPSKHYRVLHIMLESGVIYSILILMALAVSSIPYNNLFADLVAMFFHMSIGMVPPIVITLISLGKTTEYTSRDVISSIIRFEPRATHTDASHALHITLYARSTPTAVESEENPVQGRDKWPEGATLVEGPSS